SYDWALDRHGGGIGPLFRPYEMTSRFFDDIRRPVGRVWFSSDACSRLERRWIEGAIGSGIETAYAIDAGMRNELPAVAAVKHAATHAPAAG
ncbi:MAG TPA: FAD-dependent oxidoreductase, partial [Candidatus Limnocylindrales bacterium]|nr:FAD-dependent oxidoreductase [Candidatus Limnocylindrales bacterium]